MVVAALRFWYIEAPLLGVTAPDVDASRGHSSDRILDLAAVIYVPVSRLRPVAADDAAESAASIEMRVVCSGTEAPSGDLRGSTDTRP